MPIIEYYSAGKRRRLTANLAASLMNSPNSSTGMGATRNVATATMTALHSQSGRVDPLIPRFQESATLLAMPTKGHTVIVPTTTLVVVGAKKAELKRLRNRFGVEILEEGLMGKVLLRSQDAGEAGVLNAAEAALSAYQSGGVEAAHPNFLRVISRTQPTNGNSSIQSLWNHHNVGTGNHGVAGADVAARAAWTITVGSPDIRIAVLDEGVDVGHPALAHAIIAQKDFVENKNAATPSGNDAHGTACAGIIFSNDSKVPGLAPESKLVAVRIAKGNGTGNWIFDDFKTGDAIDWAWSQGKADVLSNSWGGGPPSDVISRAIEGARTKGRDRKGSVVVVATGNNDGPVSFPANLPNVLAVGASNPWDERKSKTSRDGENHWGSNFGKEVSLVAPGVFISTTDIRGANGYGTGNFINNFNGTSSATPHVAAAAALLLAERPHLTEAQVREFLTASADRLPLNRGGKRHNEVGWGRLNIFSALRLARR